MKEELFISVDIEADGDIPGEFSMLSLGACLVNDTNINFYREFKPISPFYKQENLAHTGGLDRNELFKSGVTATVGMTDFEEWIKQVSADKRPIMVAFNAPFDWMFVCYYFHRFLSRNPLGISALDIKAYYMGQKDLLWKDTVKREIKKSLKLKIPHSHNALEDAIEQAVLFKAIKTPGF